MEKIIWLQSKTFSKNPEPPDLESVNRLLREGWTVKLISSSTSEVYGQAYVVLQSPEET